MSSKRPYTLRKRAQSREETRTRIVEAAMELHEALGPRTTTISAIAERAGVQRLTVYRHFPDETAIFQACTAHWFSLNPPPDPIEWQRVDAGLPRVRAALTALYDYYRRTERMWSVSFRDEEDVPALRGPMGMFRSFLRKIGDDLLASIASTPAHTPNPGLIATIHHALSFPTWASLRQSGLDDETMVDTAVCWIAALESVSASISPEDAAPDKRHRSLDPQASRECGYEPP